METDFAPRPHKEAEALIRNKMTVSRDVFYGMLPELRGRAFAVTGVEGATVLQRIRDSIAALPQGGEDGTWDKVKQSVADELEPYLGDGADRRAELLVRTHGFQAFEAHNWRVAQEDEDTTHLQYLATEDDRVRDSHLALNGLVLPKDDPFWDTHTPPWEWGCRCRIRPMNPDMVEEERQADESRAPENRNVMEGPALDQLHNGTLLRDGQRFDVTPPKDKRSEDTPFQWHPDDLRLPVGELKQRYDPAVWNRFEAWSKGTLMAKDTTVWNWLMSKPVASDVAIAGERARMDRRMVKVQENRTPVGKYGDANSLGLPPSAALPFIGPGRTRMDMSLAQETINQGQKVISQAGIEVRFGQILGRHLQRTLVVNPNDQRARYLPSAQDAVRKPLEVWERDNRHYYIARFKRTGGKSGFVVVTARVGETADEVITFLPKRDQELEPYRHGKLVYRRSAVS